MKKKIRHQQILAPNEKKLCKDNARGVAWVTTLGRAELRLNNKPGSKTRPAVTAGNYFH